MVASQEPIVLTVPTVDGDIKNVPAVAQVMVIKPMSWSRTMQWGIAGYLSLCGLLAISVDQLIPLITGAAEHLPPAWVKVATTALTVIGIVAKYSMMKKRVEVGDLTVGAK